MSIRQAGILLALLTLVGCAAGSTQLVPQPAPDAPPAGGNMARLYIFRVPGSLSPQAQLHIKVSGQHMGWIKGGDYLVFDLPAGLHNIHMELQRSAEKDLSGTDYGDVQAGKTYYGEIDFPISRSRRPNLTMLEERDGKARIENMSPASPK
ncbi:MAG: hypothetical protein ABFS86_14720 [Planctomycetota bacterium]